MAPDRAGRVDGLGLARKEVADVDKLEDEEEKPVERDVVSIMSASQFACCGHGNGVEGSSPIQRCDQVVLGESRVEVVILVPYCPLGRVSIIWSLECVVDRCNHGENPAEKGQDLVRYDRTRGVGVPLRKGVD